MFTLAALLSCLTPARAGSWLFQVSGSGSASATNNGYTNNQPNWTPPAQATNSITIPGYGDGIGGGGSPMASSCNAQSSISAHITVTWVPDPNLPSDPAPPGVVLIETSYASASGTNGDGTTHPGSAADGLGDAADVSGNAATPSTTPAAHILHETGSSFTLDRSFSASASASSSGAYWTGGHPGAGTFVPASYSCGVTVGSYTVSIHAQPYNWHQTNVTDNLDGTLSFSYDWQSTSGNKADLTSCFIHEWVTYPTPPGTPLVPTYYAPPSPFNASLPNPTVQPGTGNQGQPATDPNGGYDTQFVPGYASPYSSASFTATQTYEFDDTATGESNVRVPGPDSGPLSITRTIGNRAPYASSIWWYSVTKNGSTAWFQLN